MLSSVKLKFFCWFALGVVIVLFIYSSFNADDVEPIKDSGNQELLHLDPKALASANEVVYDNNSSESVNDSEKDKVTLREELVSENYIASLGNDLSNYSEKEKLIIRKYFTYKTLPEEELPIFFKFYTDGLFSNRAEEHLNSFTSNVSDSWVSQNLSNYDMQYWESSSDTGDVLSTMILGRFYKDVKYFEMSEKFYQRAYVNINEGGVAIENLINLTKEVDEKKAAAYAWFSRHNDFKIYDGQTVNRLTETFSFVEVETEFEGIQNTFESLQVNYANSKKIDIKKLIN